MTTNDKNFITINELFSNRVKDILDYYGDLNVILTKADYDILVEVLTEELVSAFNYTGKLEAYLHLKDYMK